MTRTLEPTEREVQVLLAVTEPNATQASAAVALGISTHTVKATLRLLYQKLDVRTPGQAYRVLTQRGRLS